jgi:ankyrin repeat protein
VKKTFCPLLTCAFLLLHMAACADGSLPALPRFPMERLEEARRALDAARGDTAAVKEWLSQGKDPDVQGEFDQVSSIDSGSLPRLFEALTGSAAPEWVDAVAFSRIQGEVILLSQGMTLQRVLRELGIAGSFMAFFSSDDPNVLQTTFRISDTVQLDVSRWSMTLRTSYGTFEFGKPWAGLSGPIGVDGSELLTGWSVKGAELKVRTRDDRHLAMLAVAPRAENVLATLVIQGIPSFNPLYCAVAYGRSEVIKALIAAGASEAAAGLRGETALHVAARWGRSDSASTLLDAGLDIDARAEGGTTPLMAAVERLPRRQVAVSLESREGTVRWLLEATLDRLPSIGGTEGQGPEAGAAGRISGEEMALFLLSRGADPTIRREDGENILFHASRRGMLSLVGRLIEEGVDLDGRDAKGETAVFAAVRQDNRHVLELLLDHGASEKLRNRGGESPKAVAAKLRSADCMAVFVSRQRVHWSVAPTFNSSWSSIDGYIIAPGMGGVFDLHIRLSRLFMLTAEAGYTVRGIFADTIDPWLISTEGEPYFEYKHIDLACMLDFELLRLESMWVSAVAGLGYQLQTSASILTDSGLWDPIDISSRLESSGLSLILGVGLNGFLPRGILLGVEGRYLRTLSGQWTGQGGGMGSLILLIRIGS